MTSQGILFSVFLLSASVATAQADVYAANTEGSSVTVYATTAIGDVPPARTISGPSTGFNSPISVTTDVSHGELYVCDFFGQAIRVFALGASGDATPLRTLINGPNSQLGQPRMVGLDLVHNEIYVISFTNAIHVYPRTASGDAVPTRTIQGAQTRISNSITIVLDLLHDEILLDSYTAGGTGVPGILVFARTASGDVPPLRVIAGTLTQFGTFTNAVALNTGVDEIYAQGNDGQGVLTFPRTASGNVAPIRDITGPSTGIQTVNGILADDGNGRLILADGTANGLLVFDRLSTGDINPVMSVSGPNTGLVTPWGLALDGTGGFTGFTDAVAESGTPGRPSLFLGANPGVNATPTPIDFSLPRAGHATVDVFASDGRRVAAVLDRELGEGPHLVSWDRALAPVASGVYFVRLSEGKDRIVRKLVIR